MAYISFQPNDYFSTKLYTGTGSSNAITGVGFQPDWVWIKKRNATGQHQLFDAVRGVTKRVYSDSSDPESTSATTLTAFGTDGFTVGSNSGINGSSDTIVSWNWLANGAGSSNTDGTINTTATSVNTTAGFSISTYSGTGSAATIGHGLGAVPQVMIVKNTYQAESWIVYHQSLGGGTPQDKYLHLNTTDAEGDSAAMWNDTAPTSSVFSVGTSTSTNQAGGTFVAYCFAEKQGFSKFGSYTGNGNADGAFIYTGFKPAFVLVKETGTGNWIIKDNKRPIYNQNDTYLFANTSDAESSASTLGMDLLSNGFKLRATAGDMNGSGTEIIYMAFAEEPLVSSNGVPAVAR